MINNMNRMELAIPIEYSPVSNFLVYREVAKFNLKIPQPPIVELDDGRTTEHTLHPVYQDALTVYQIQQSIYAFDVLLKFAVSFDKRLMYENKEWKNYKKHILKDVVDEPVAFLKYFVFAENPTAKNLLTQNVILHEGQVFDIFNMLTVARDGVNIHEAHIRNAVKVDIQVIPLIIEGNHDNSNPNDTIDSWLHYLEKSDLARRLSYKKIHDKYFFDSVKIEDINFYGLGYPGYNVDNVALNLTDFLDANEKNIVLIHTAIGGGENSTLPGLIKTETLKKLSEKTIYIGGGHFHSKSAYPAEKPFFFIPGSTEYWNILNEKNNEKTNKNGITNNFHE